MTAHVPYKNKKLVYTDYTLDMATSNVADIVSSSHFYKVWNDHFDKIKIRRHKKFGRCDECQKWLTQLKNCIGARKAILVNVLNYCVAQKAVLYEKFWDHLEEQRRERRESYHHMELARTQPTW